MKNALLKLFLIISANCFSQITFDKGYFINNANEKMDCLIKNMDWNDTPKFFKYKLDESSELLTGDVSNVKEFRVYNQPKYNRIKVRFIGQVTV